MTSFRHLALALALATLPSLAFPSVSAPGDDAPRPTTATSKPALVDELMRVTGVIDLGNQVAAEMGRGFKQQLPPADHPIIDELFAELDMREMQGEIHALYMRSFTEQELRDILAFYATPSGRSMLAKTPALMQESMAIGQAWGARKADEVIARLRAREAAPSATTEEEPLMVIDAPPPAPARDGRD